MRVQLALLSAFLLVTALLSGVNAKCAADASLEVTHEANLNGVVYIEKLIINSQWNFSFTEGDTLNISFAGSDSGSVSASWSADNTTLTATFAIAAGGNTPSEIVYSPRPRRQIVSSASSNVVGLNSIITLVTGLLFARSNKKGLIMLAVAFLMLSVTMETTMAQTVECPSATITATIPRGLVRRICNADETECQCGPGFSGANCDPEVQVPVAAPVATPVTAPVSTPVAAPVTPPVAAPVTAPVAAPVTAPVAAPVTPPVAAPIAAPVTPPVAAPVDVPVAAPVATPVDVPVAAPVDTPIATPVDVPVAAPVDVPTAVPTGVAK